MKKFILVIVMLFMLVGSAYAITEEVDFGNFTSVTYTDEPYYNGFETQSDIDDIVFIERDFITNSEPPLYFDYYGLNDSRVWNGSYSLLGKMATNCTGNDCIMTALFNNTYNSIKNETFNFTIFTHHNNPSVSVYMYERIYFLYDFEKGDGYTLAPQVSLSGTYDRNRIRIMRWVNGSVTDVICDSSTLTTEINFENDDQWATHNFYILTNGSWSFHANNTDGQSFTCSGVESSAFTEGQFGIDFRNRQGIGSTDEELLYDNLIGASGFYTADYSSTILEPQVSISSPSDKLESNTSDIDVQFTVTDDNASTMSCSIYVDSVLNQTNSTTANDTLTTFDITWDEGLHTYYVRCSDGDKTGDSETQSIYIDTEEPDINSIYPDIFNSTVYIDDVMNLTGNVTNLNLTEVTRQVMYPNSSVFLYNQTIAFADVTLHQWNETYNTSGEPNGVWTMWIFAEDTLNNSINKTYSFEVANCIPDWTCTGYSSCNISDLAPCNNVTDLNSCGENYTGDYSEFSPQSCNYCAYDLELLVTGTCDLNTGLRNDTYIDNNFGTCCNVTGLESDCAFGAGEETGIVNNSCSGNYNSDYESEDMAKVVVDGLVIFLISLVGFAGVIGIIIVYRMIRGRLK